MTRKYKKRPRRPLPVVIRREGPDVKGILLTCSLFAVFFSLLYLHRRGILIFSLYSAADIGHHMLYQLLNASMLGLYALICGLGGGKKNRILRYLIFILCVALVLAGFTFPGIGIQFNFPPFHPQYNRFVTNSIEGVTFFIYNLEIFLIIYSASFLSEAEEG